jgi:hypothetical protein
MQLPKNQGSPPDLDDGWGQVCGTIGGTSPVGGGGL